MGKQVRVMKTFPSISKNKYQLGQQLNFRHLSRRNHCQFDSFTQCEIGIKTVIQIFYSYSKFNSHTYLLDEFTTFYSNHSSFLGSSTSSPYADKVLLTILIKPFFKYSMLKFENTRMFNLKR